jgi:hypothetical protein
MNTARVHGEYNVPFDPGTGGLTGFNNVVGGYAPPQQEMVPAEATGTGTSNLPVFDPSAYKAPPTDLFLPDTSRAPGPIPAPAGTDRLKILAQETANAARAKDIPNVKAKQAEMLLVQQAQKLNEFNKLTTPQLQQKRDDVLKIISDRDVSIAMKDVVIKDVAILEGILKDRGVPKKEFSIEVFPNIVPGTKTRSVKATTSPLPEQKIEEREIPKDIGEVTLDSIKKSPQMSEYKELTLAIDKLSNTTDTSMSKETRSAKIKELVKKRTEIQRALNSLGKQYDIKIFFPTRREIENNSY